MFLHLINDVLLFVQDLPREPESPSVASNLCPIEQVALTHADMLKSVLQRTRKGALTWIRIVRDRHAVQDLGSEVGSFAYLARPKSSDPAV